MGVVAPDVDDACQDVFLRLFRALPGFRGEAEIKTWLYRLCATVASRCRQRTEITQAVLRILAWRRAETAACSPGDENTESRLLEYALSRLRHSERLPFVLYELEGLSGKEIAQIIGIPEATVYTRLHYARRTFRAALGEGEAA
jgi:RNA polymerase sigma-70 factor (ECF subfamily)